MFSLAVIPSIVLLVYIYKKDKREKEPMPLLMSCFLFGILIIAPVLVMETVLSVIEDSLFTPGSVFYAAFDGIIVAALSEELFKYLALKFKTWKSKEFNCTFDGIVYAVFVSLGFATVENINYVADGGISSAIGRMFTAVPSHACDAVFMGYFYSKAKKASLENNTKLEKKYKKLALFVPIMVHGIYDCLISFEEDVAGEAIVVIGILLWFAVIIAQFICAFVIVNIASKNDTALNISAEWPYQGNAAGTEPVYLFKKGVWLCGCNNMNNGNFCTACGTAKDAGVKMMW